MMKVLNCFLLLSLLGVSRAGATPQVLDVLRFEGNTRAIWYVRPLQAKITPELYAEWTSPRWCTACLSGYYAKWDIIDQDLVLTDIMRMQMGAGLSFTSVPLSVISPDWTNHVRATWFSGTFETPIWQSHKGVGLPIFISRQFCIEKGRLTSASVIFPILSPLRPYLFTIPLIIAVLILGFLLYKLRTAHNKPAHATGKPAPGR